MSSTDQELINDRAPSLPGPDRLLTAAIAALVGVGAVARVLLHHGVTYVRGDEQIYAFQGCRIAGEGLGSYPRMVRDYLASSTAYLSPSPLRWVFVLINGGASKVWGCGPSTVAWVSTFAGIAMLVLVAAMSTRYLGRWVALAATAFVASSPLQLALGRRALGDELVGAMALAALWCVLRYCERRSTGRLVALVALLYLACGTKEIFILLYPALFLPLVVMMWRERRVHAGDVIAIVMPTVLNAATFALLARSLSAYPHVLHDVQRSASSEYVRLYMNGPPQRILVDLIALSPIVTLLALVAVGLVLEQPAREPRILAGITVMMVLPYAIASAKTIRLVVSGETLVCVLAAWGICWALRGRHRAWTVAIAAAGVAANLLVFAAINRYGFYDPLTVNIMQALRMTP